jgi:NAD(P)-dependent dehydrogenase (short-subunit alcohol dehydrogenase family)
MKTALVTGSSRGIGRAVADLLGEKGYAVVYSATSPSRPEGLPEGADYFPCDITDAAQRDAVFAHIQKTYGHLDVLVNNAGVAPVRRADLLEMSEESLDRVLGVNLKGTFFMCQAAAKLMLAYRRAHPDETAPRIVNIGSLSAYTSSTMRGEYCISKAGVGMVTMLLADRLAAERIPVFEVRPGIIETDMTSVVHEKYQKMIDEGLLPVSRFGQPEDVAKMVYACCTGLLDYSAGQVLNADGGFSLRRL